jgi:hypothetical protein
MIRSLGSDGRVRAGYPTHVTMDRWIWLTATCRCRTCGAVERALWPVLDRGTSTGPDYIMCDACGEMTLWPIAPAAIVNTPRTIRRDIVDETTTLMRRHRFS